MIRVHTHRIETPEDRVIYRRPRALKPPRVYDDPKTWPACNRPLTPAERMYLYACEATK